jgi:hypothetical protein
MYEYSMEHICSYSARLQSPPEIIGPTPEGLRLNVYVAGGEVTGPRLQGKVLPVGADWLTIRPDGVGILDVRATLATDDGALIYVAYRGVGDAGEDGYQRFLDGDLPERLPLRVVPRYMTAHPDYLWLNRLQCVNIGEADLRNWVVSYDVYALR